MGVYAKTLGPMSWTAAIVGGLIAGVVFGATMAFSLDKHRRDLRAAAGELPANTFTAARRAADRGPVPTDPNTRAAARRIATRQLERCRGVRIFFIAGSALLLVATVGMPVIGWRWRRLYALVAAGLLIVQWYWPRRIRRRIQLLSEATEQTAN